MSRHTKRKIGNLVLAVSLGVLGFFSALPALAEEPDVALPDPSSLPARVGLLAVAIIGAVRLMRQFLPALSDGSLFAKRVTALAAVAFGLLFGAIGWAGVIDGSRLFPGFLASCVAYFGAGILGSKARLESDE